MNILQRKIFFWLYCLLPYRYLFLPEGTCLDVHSIKTIRPSNSNHWISKSDGLRFHPFSGHNSLLFVKPLSIHTVTSNHGKIKLRHGPDSSDTEKDDHENNARKIIVVDSSEIRELSSYNKFKHSLVKISNKFVDTFRPVKDYVRKTRVYEVISAIMDKVKIMLLMFGQLLYSFVLPNFHILLPYQLLPIESGLGIDIGVDTIVSMIFFCLFLRDLNASNKPFTVPENIKKRIPFVVLSLIGSYVLSGYFTQVVDNLILLISAMDIPVSVAMHQSLRVLIGHLFWVFIGSLIIDKTMFPLSINLKTPWYRLQMDENWVFPSLSGYFLSCTLYNLADVVHHFLLKIYNYCTCYSERFDNNDENLVSQLTESNEILPTILGALGPCITAPWWEETLYRILILKSLNIYLPHLLSSVISSFLFAVHHLNPRSVIHLFVLGIIWSLIEKKFDNILVTMIIHSLWNSRIFLGSMLGL